MTRHVCASLAVPFVLACVLTACQAAPAEVAVADTPEINYEGLQTVPSRRFNVVQIRPETNFGRYSKVVLRTPELAYRTPDRSRREFPLKQEQKDRLHDQLVASFDKEFAKLRRLEVTDADGPETLALDVRVEDIVVSAPRSAGRVGRAAAMLETRADAVLVIELSDSQSNEILARAVDAGAASGGAIRTPEGEMRSRFEAPERVVEEWAAKTRAGLENLLAERG
jgi:hypothetical protein